MITLCASEHEDSFSETGADINELLSCFDGDKIFVGVRTELADASVEERSAAEGEGWAWIASRVQVFTRGVDFVEDIPSSEIKLTYSGLVMAAALMREVGRSQCACPVVVHSRFEHNVQNVKTYSFCWVCKDCGTEFAPKAVQK